MIIKEFCAENATNIKQAIERGAGRIELCDNLSAGGTTPSPGVVELACKLAGDVAIMAMLRPRGGDFCYNDLEKDAMLSDLAWLVETDVKGIVFGALTSDSKELDKVFLEELIKICHEKDKEVTFHMAFDELDEVYQVEAIAWLSYKGVKRILTHGGSQDKSIEETLPRLKELVAYADGEIIILPGGGVNSSNYEKVASELGVKEVHGTKIVGNFE